MGAERAGSASMFKVEESSRTLPAPSGLIKCRSRCRCRARLAQDYQDRDQNFSLAIVVVGFSAGIKIVLTSSAHRSRVIPEAAGGYDVVETAGTAAGLS